MSEPVTPIVDAYEHTVRALLELAATMPEDQWHVPTWLTGWDVADNVAHVAALERQLLGEDVSSHELPSLVHVVNPIQAHMERGVDVRRSWSRSQIVDDLRGALDGRLAVLRDPSLTTDSPVPGLMGGEGPAGRLLPVRVFDCWAHEQDVRAAIGRPGNLDSPAAVISYARMAMGAPAMASNAGLSDGQAVAVVVDDPLPVHFTVGDADAAPGATIRTDGAGLFRLVAGRGDWREVPVRVEGDAELALQVLGAMAITP